jgi:proteasome lid subunit RPN8/RPN11
MKTILKLRPGLFEDLVMHLLPRDNTREQAAFLFASCSQAEDVSFNVQQSEKLTPDDFDSQDSDYLELKDKARARLIKRAHDLQASLIELHSHPGPWPAAFSPADRLGLSETVPHMWWRLHKRPYVAIVVAPSGFDALVWLENPKVPQALDVLMAGKCPMKPTNNSLGGWS